MFGEDEYFFVCPYCCENISMLIDVLNGNQKYIEDCEVCCKPIEIQYSCEDGLITSFLADSIQ